MNQRVSTLSSGRTTARTSSIGVGLRFGVLAYVRDNGTRIEPVWKQYTPKDLIRSGSRKGTRLSKGCELAELEVARSTVTRAKNQTIGIIGCPGGGRRVRHALRPRQRGITAAVRR